jgi:drug/metabolite transporter (DMT)-like permease
MGLPSDRRVVAAFVAVVALGATNLVLVVFSTRDLDPLWNAGLRFSIAAVLTLIAARSFRLPLPRGRDLRVAALYGALAFGVSFGLFYWGSQEVPAGVASVILGSVPLLTMLLASAQRLEPFAVSGLVGAALSIAGIATISAGAPAGTVAIVPLLAVVAAQVSAAQGAITIRRIPDVHPIAMNAIGMSVGGALLMLASFASGESHVAPSTTSVQLALAFLALSTPVLFMLFVFVTQRWSASASSYVFVLFPLVSVPLAIPVLHEAPSPALLAGAPLVLLGVWFGVLAPGRRRSAALATARRHSEA